jgi:hypothetical protein
MIPHPCIDFASLSGNASGEGGIGIGVDVAAGAAVVFPPKGIINIAVTTGALVAVAHDGTGLG